jgi:hypothetical protein
LSTLGEPGRVAQALRRPHPGDPHREQAEHDGSEVSESIPATTPLYTWNLADTGTGTLRPAATVGGLTDAGFRLIQLIEAGRDGTWPWE